MIINFPQREHREFNIVFFWLEKNFSENQRKKRKMINPWKIIGSNFRLSFYRETEVGKSVSRFFLNNFSLRTIPSRRGCGTVWGCKNCGRRRYLGRVDFWATFLRTLTFCQELFHSSENEFPKKGGWCEDGILHHCLGSQIFLKSSININGSNFRLNIY